MEFENELPLDISEFKCVSLTPSAVAVVFSQTKRRYTYVWNGIANGLSEPQIEGSCGPHPAAVIDCLARAVAHKAARDAFGNDTEEAAPTPRSRVLQIRSFLSMRGATDGRTRPPRH